MYTGVDDLPNKLPPLACWRKRHNVVSSVDSRLLIMTVPTKIRSSP